MARHVLVGCLRDNMYECVLHLHLKIKHPYMERLQPEVTDSSAPETVVFDQAHVASTYKT